ncbi:hypothetical protein KEJ47_06675 [Candidatus Bathyarchaeota archaeon]|nr:hypothetical protein [Candidatus Bathyarchaeota archaeon]
MKIKYSTVLTFIVIFASIASAMAVTGALTFSRTIGNSGRLKAVNVEVYSDSACTQPLSSIDWGDLEPGSVKERTIYIKNTGNTGLKLSLSTSGWSPSSASNYISLTWNREGVTISSGSTISATLSLSVSSSVSDITTFSFNIIIQGTA